MSKFDAAFDYMIQYEGTKFVDNPADKGGPTKFGISTKFLLEQHKSKEKDNSKICNLNVDSYMLGIFEKQIKNLTIEQAKEIYQKYFWLPIYEQIENQDIANYVFDMAVNHGHKNAAIIAQRACRAAESLIVEDGIFGPKTLEALHDYIGFDPICYIHPSLKSERAGFMRCIVAHNPNQQEFLVGWLKRAYGEKL